MHSAGIHSVHQPHDRRIRAIPDSQINQTYIHNSLIIHLGKPIASADWKTPTMYGTTESVTGRQASSHTIALFMTYPAGGRVCPRSRSSSAGAVADPTATCCEGASADDPRASAEIDDDLPECAPFTDMSEGGGHLVEREDPVDVDLHPPGHAQVGQRLEMGRDLPSPREHRSIGR